MIKDKYWLFMTNDGKDLDAEKLLEFETEEAAKSFFDEQKQKEYATALIYSWPHRPVDGDTVPIIFVFSRDSGWYSTLPKGINSKNVY